MICYRDRFAKLIKMQKVGLFVSYAGISLAAGLSIYYGGAMLADNIENGLFLGIIRVTAVILILWLAITVLNRLAHKITKGVFPDTR
ncbi:hypothetical protein [Bacillus massiliglaciei]|uniref:hypothetical protein n=1 Tax=Bacillus massiliglaciei TaxID=1816693 RepID=UPI000DA61A1D|nr:hypothetical protein [Bacillus massiliglaciei]